ncbi:Ger(x)C family spore germination C-terminal domain-containing protein [Neobacillus drentensis]|uniref:Ger(x)C family spore germination C-terminal domain-containing protein n=1 Tax=Neobacillus drentensis TaxID=220684 RepID=UPI002FFDB94E
MLEKIKDIPINNLIKLIEEDIKTKVLRIYNEGIEKNTDVLNVGEKWYREHPQQYKKLMKTSRWTYRYSILIHINMKRKALVSSRNKKASFL